MLYSTGEIPKMEENSGMITEAEDEDDMKMNTARDRDHCFEQDQLLQSAAEFKNG